MPVERIRDLTILIPVKDDQKVLDCLRSIDVACSVLVVFNGASEAFIEWVRSSTDVPFAEVIVERPGLGNAYNVGLASIRTEFVLLMDSDCQFMGGSISALRAMLNTHPLSKGVIEFTGRTRLERVVARHRFYTTCDRVSAYSPPLAFSKSVVLMFMGRYFDDIPWAEDFLFDLRVQRAGLRIGLVENARILHPPISVRADLRASFNYGYGHGLALAQCLVTMPKMGSVTRFFKDVAYLAQLRRRLGNQVALYGLLWSLVLNLGFMAGTRGGTTKSAHSSTAR